MADDFGLYPGDIVTTSYVAAYGSRYRIRSITPLAYVQDWTLDIIVRSWMVCSMECDDISRNERANAYLNDIRRVGQRWFSDQNDELILLEQGPRRPEPPKQVSLFDAPSAGPQPYPFQPDVLYPNHTPGVDPATIWVRHCSRCSKDWNTAPKVYMVRCPACGYPSGQRVYVMKPRFDPTEHVWTLRNPMSSYSYMMGTPDA